MHSRARRDGDDAITVGRNLRNVWTIATQAYSEAHFATFPAELAERCIRAGTSERGCCAACGKPWVRVVERHVRTGSYHDHSNDLAGGMSQPQPAKLMGSDYYARYVSPTTTGWSPSCACGKVVSCPHCGDTTEHDVPLSGYTCGACDEPFSMVKPCVVLDPFSGACTTLLVAQRLQRDAIGVELNPDYVAMGRQRIEDEAGLFADVQTLTDAPIDAALVTEAPDYRNDRSAYSDPGDAQPSLWDNGRGFMPRDLAAD